MLNIGNKRELFFDDYLLNTKKTTAQKKLHHPQKREPVMIYNMPWEGNNAHYQTIIFDGEKYIMYYYACAMASNGARSRYCYATSKDGLHWERPILNVAEFDGSTENNIVLTKGVIPDQDGYDNFTVFYDENPACPKDEKYKALVMWCGHTILRSFVSPDGIHFKVRGVITDDGAFDSLNICFWDKYRQKYLCYYRGEHAPREDAPVTVKSYTDKIARMLYDPEKGAYRDPGDGTVAFTRDIRVIESTDFVHWSENQRIVTDGPDIQYYTNGVMPYARAPHLLVAFPTRYVERKAWTPNYEQLCGRELRLQKMKGSAREGLALTDCLFMASRDGYNFTRYDEAFMAPPPEADLTWYYGDCYPAACLIETPSDIPGADNEYSLFGNCADQSTPDGHAKVLCRYTIRLDGFVSLHAGASEECVLTKEFTYDGDELYVNIATSAWGSAYFCLHCEGESFLSHEIFGNSTDKKISFEDPTAVQKCRGKAVTLEVRMLDCDLYAIRFGS